MRSPSRMVALLLSALAACGDVGPLAGTDGEGTADGPGLPAEESLGHKLVTSQNAIPGQYIVVLDDQVALDGHDPGGFISDLVNRYAGEVLLTYSQGLLGYAARMTPDEALRLSADPRVAYVEEDAVISLSALQTGATWGLDRIDQRALPLNTSYVNDPSGAGVHAYVIDTGIRTDHAELVGRLGKGKGTIKDGNGTNDCNGHGTHVAGTVGGKTYGVAKAVTLHPVRVLNCKGSGTNSNVLDGINWVVQNRELPAVANLSLGGSTSRAIDDAVKKLVNAGVTTVVAAGNSNADACRSSPARTPAAITVGATTKTDARASFSNWGGCVDLFAPGDGITSAWATSATATNTISGTSMAAPHVAGAAALYLSKTPGASPDQVATALLTNATSGAVSNPNNSPNKLLYMGFLSSTTPPPPAPAPGGTPPGGSTPPEDPCAADLSCSNDPTCTSPDPDCTPLGSPCSLADQCQHRQCVSNTDGVGRFCSRACTENRECPVGMLCGVSGVCRKEEPDAIAVGQPCTDGDLCVAGAVCSGRDAAAYTCQPECSLNSDCGSGQRCEMGANNVRFCRPYAATTPRRTSLSNAELACSHSSGTALPMLIALLALVLIPARRGARPRPLRD